MKILVVDDEPVQREMLQGFLENQGHEVIVAGDGGEALRLHARHPFELVLLDHRMPEMTGDQVLARMKADNPLVHSIMLTAYGSVETAVTAMKLGADDFMEKPVDLKRLIGKIDRIERRVAVETEAAAVSETLDRSIWPLDIIGDSPAMQEVFSLVQRLAPTPWTVMIRGETGTGKELFARLIHLLSPFRDGAFIEVNCSAIPENLFESELFGHEKGSFTGATARRRGRFELARGGTLFLDEIGELPLALQPKLLRALQQKKIMRVGGEVEIEVDVRVIAATNRDLDQRVQDGLFREDLFFRLKVLDLELPPLRQRREDIPELVDFFVQRYGRSDLRLANEALTTLVKYDFPGNVRELEHIIQRTVTLSRGNPIPTADLPAEVRLRPAVQEGKLTERIEAVEREMVLAALEQAGGVQTKAAGDLGISERVLRYKMKKHGIKKRP